MKRTDRIARQLRALMDRHRLSAAELEKRTVRHDQPVPISAVTIRRILNAEGKDGADFETLERLAMACGEIRQQAFPEEGEATSREIVIATIAGRHISLKVEEGLDVDAQFVDRLNEFVLAHPPQLAKQRAEQKAEMLRGKAQPKPRRPRG